MEKRNVDSSLRGRLLRRGIAVIAVLGVASTSLVGCANAGSTTCADWASKSSSERSDIASSMLRSKNLETADLGNQLGITSNINDYCGILGLPGAKEKSKNPDAAIENAVDWSNGKW